MEIKIHSYWDFDFFFYVVLLFTFSLCLAPGKYQVKQKNTKKNPSCLVVWKKIYIYN